MFKTAWFALTTNINFMLIDEVWFIRTVQRDFIFSDRATTVTRSWRVKVTQYDCGTDVPGIGRDFLHSI